MKEQLPQKASKTPNTTASRPAGRSSARPSTGQQAGSSAAQGYSRPANGKTAKAAAGRGKKRHRLTRRQMTIIVFASIVVVSGVLIGLLVMAGKAQPAENTGKPSAFGVKKIEVEGLTKYEPDAVIKGSGLWVGQSLFSVNKKLAAEQIVQQFPYIDTVNIRNTSLDTIAIEVTEVAPIGVMKVKDTWLVIGGNGKAVEALDAASERLNSYMHIQGAVPLTGTVGSKAMDDRSWKIVTTMLSAINSNTSCQIQGQAVDMQGFSAMDLTDTADIQLDWRNQITVRMGSEANANHKVAVAMTAVAHLIKSQGNAVAGQMDVRSYSGTDSAKYRAVYTPKELLQSTTAASVAGTTAVTASTTASSHS